MNKKMSGLGGKVIAPDAQLEELSFMGGINAKGNLTVRNLNVKGGFNVRKSLFIESNGFLKLNGGSKIEDDLVSQSDCYIKGSCKVGGKISALEATINGNGRITTTSLVAQKLVHRGSLQVSEDIVVKESIRLEISKNDVLKVGGRMQAPKIRLKSYRKNIFSRFILSKIFKLSAKQSLVFTDLHIKTDVLELSNVEVKGNIQAGTIIQE